MERKIGEIFQYKGEWYQCMEGTGCYKCDFNIDENTCIADNPHCTCRSDKKNVIFKKLEKVGEPYMDGGKIMQKYKRVYQEPIYFPYKELNCYNDLHGRICIEIKQTKEDMEEEREYTEDEFKNSPRFQHHKNIEQVINMKKMKEFDINLAKQGKPVCTRDGRKARIICFDLKNDEYPIVAAIGNDSSETLFFYTTNGKIADGIETDKDLMLLPEKKNGWVIIRKGDIYETEELARKALINSRTAITIKKITWEE